MCLRTDAVLFPSSLFYESHKSCTASYLFNGLSIREQKKQTKHEKKPKADFNRIEIAENRMAFVVAPSLRV